ncbi:MAG TPA: phosphopyruvate hydratase, partial [Gemmataceae bacterium]|nr:phosphopyruvate hydratase [Gemmataceae bacterium]
MSADTITRIAAREVLDSRGNPTVEVDVYCEGGARGRAIVPSGASTGRHEAVELRDGDAERFGGKGVRKAVANVRGVIAPRLAGTPAGEQDRIDRTLCELDGTPNKARLGANAILGVSLACAHAAAAVRGLPLWKHLAPSPQPLSPGGRGVPDSPLSPRGRGVGGEGPRLPLPMVNLISGGLHAGGNLDFQDFLLLPIGAHSYSEALAMAVNVYRALSGVLTRHGFEGVLVGDEGGFGPKLHGNEQAVQMCVEAIRAAGYEPGRDAALALDVASTHFYHADCYRLKATAGVALSADDMVRTLRRWADDYPILSIEDGMAEDDWPGWQKLTKDLGRRVQLIGDDLFVTNPGRLRRGIDTAVANAVLVKVNQV